MIRIPWSSIRRKARALADGDAYLTEVLEAGRREGVFVFMECSDFSRLAARWAGAERLSVKRAGRPSAENTVDKTWRKYCRSVADHGSPGLKKDLSRVEARLAKMHCGCSKDTLMQRFMAQNPVEGSPVEEGGAPAPFTPPPLWFMYPGGCVAENAKAGTTAVAHALAVKYHNQDRSGGRAGGPPDEGHPHAGDNSLKITRRRRGLGLSGDFDSAWAKMPGIAHMSCPRRVQPEGVRHLLVRDPVDRFFSACAQTNRDPDKALEELEHGAEGIAADVHFRRQSVFAGEGVRLYRFPGHLADLAEHIGVPVIEHLNKCKKQKRKATREQAARIDRIYSEDRVLFESIEEPGMVSGDATGKGTEE